MQLCGVLGAGAAGWGFTCRCRVLGADRAAVWGFRSRYSCVGFRYRCMVLGALT